MIKICSYKSIDENGQKQLFSIEDISTDMNKLASVSLPLDMVEFLKSYTPSSPNVDVYISTAMGSGEFYGPNLNGDYFPADMLKKTHKTFETNAKFFKFHRNKPTDDNYGLIPFATYDNNMQRVMLVIEVNGKELPEIGLRYKNGDPVFVSMGCAVPYDICSICGNRAKTPRNYCDHLRYERLNIYPDGRQPYMINPTGRFFDLSWVIVPADRTAFFITKVDNENIDSLMPEEINKAAKIEDGFLKAASLSEIIIKDKKTFNKTSSLKPENEDEDSAKTAEDKIGLMIKKITTKVDPELTQKANEKIKEIVDARLYEEELPEEIIDKISLAPLPKILSTCSSLGFILKPREFQRILLKSLKQHDLYDLLEKYKCYIEDQDLRNVRNIPILNMKANLSDKGCASILAPYFEKKSYFLSPLNNRIKTIKVANLKSLYETFTKKKSPDTYEDIDFSNIDPLMDLIKKSDVRALTNYDNEVNVVNPEISGIESLMAVLGAGYLGYLMKNSNLMSKLTDSSRLLGLSAPFDAALAGVGLLGGGALLSKMVSLDNKDLLLTPKQIEMLKRDNSYNRIINPYMFEPDSNLTKEAGIMLPLAGMVGGIALSSVQKVQDRDPNFIRSNINKYRGVRGWLRNTITDHPVATGLSAAGVLSIIPKINTISSKHPWATIASLATPWYLL